LTADPSSKGRNFQAGTSRVFNRALAFYRNWRITFGGIDGDAIDIDLED
jgi:hypothetical protein